MADNETESPWRDLRSRLDANDREGVLALLDEWSPAVVGRALSRLDVDTRNKVFEYVPSERAADLFEALTEAQAAAIIEELPSHRAASIVEELESDHRADILAELDDDDMEAILGRINPENAADARRLMEYDEDTAGGLMFTEYVLCRVDQSVGEVLADMRRHANEYADYGVHYLYVAAESGRLVGVVRLGDLLLAPAKKTLGEIMLANPLHVTTDTHLDELDDFFERYPFYSVPVTDDDEHMVGVVRRSDVEEAIGEEAERTLMRLGGIMGGEEIRDMPLRQRAGHRLAWLCLNMALSLMAASVVLGYEDTINELFALVFFMPVICNMSGCSGNQAVAVSIRELSLGLIQPRDYGRVWFKEIGVGIINGLILGTMMGIIADFIWGSGYFALGLVIGGAFALNTLIAVSLGGLLPLALRGLGFDPALAAPPILTTTTDMCGFLVVLSLATMALQYGVI